MSPKSLSRRLLRALCRRGVHFLRLRLTRIPTFRVGADHDDVWALVCWRDPRCSVVAHPSRIRYAGEVAR